MVDQYFRKVDIFRPAALAEEDGYIGKNAIAKNATGTTQPVFVRVPSEPEPQPASTEAQPAEPSKPASK